jgi:hypothetical protein
MPHPLAPLADLPPGYAEAAALIDGFDRCLLVGFGRLGPDQQSALSNLSAAFAGTSMAAPLSAAVEAVGRGEFREGHFAAFAAARAALQGAQYDALRKQASAALGRPFDPAADAADPPKVDGPFAAWGESARHWLTELALAGFKQLEAAAVLPFAATLENLEGEPRAVRQAAVLGGFQHELLNSVPAAALPEVPLHRWADLWTRGMVGTLMMPTPPAGAKAGGTLFPLGTEYRAHASFAAYVVYGVLEDKGPPRAVRVSLTTYKVDALRGREVWRSFPAEYKPLLAGLADGKGVSVTGCTLLPTGDLLWDGKTAAGPKFDPFAKAAESLNAEVVVSPAAPADRHPVQLAEPVFLDGFTVSDNAVSLADGPTLPLLPAALPPWGEVTPADVKAAERMVALLRFDAGRWHVQPLAVQGGGKKATRAVSGGGAVEALAPKKKGDTLAVLKERASRLLRGKK